MIKFLKNEISKDLKAKNRQRIRKETLKLLKVDLIHFVANLIHPQNSFFTREI